MELAQEPPDRHAAAPVGESNTESAGHGDMSAAERKLSATRFTDLHRLGCSVFPIKARDKKPVGKWKEFQTQPATIAQAEQWDVSNHNVGIATGPVSGFWVLDIDNDAAEASAREKGWIRDDTACVKTGKGRHYCYKVAADQSVENTTALTGVCGVDIRGQGGFVVGPGSIHPNGHAYLWEKHPDDVPFAEAPEALLKALRAGGRSERPERTGRAHSEGGNGAGGGEPELVEFEMQLANAVEGTRNDLLNRAAFRLGQLVAAGRAQRDNWISRLRGAAQACGLPDEEIDDVLGHAVAAGEADPRVQDAATGGNGRQRATVRAARIALGQLGVSVSYDEFADRYLIQGLPGFGAALDDAALNRLRFIVEERWRLSYGKERWADIVTDFARLKSFHPVRDYLKNLQWDGTHRLDSWLVTYAGAEDNEYTHAVGALVLVAAVRRVRQPGCKFDEMPVFESPQGTNKSSALALMAVNEDWFADDLPLDSDSKVVMERIAGRWIVELAELKGMRRGAVEHVKAMVSRRVDKARLAYARLPTMQPRQCVFFGTTNDDKYLRDMTGNRRFWPVQIDKFNLEALGRDRDQLWAEAAAREAEGVSIRLPEHLWAVASGEQSRRLLEDPFYEVLSERLDGLEGKVRSSDIWEVVGFGDKGRRTQDHNVRLSGVMKTLGWERPKSVLRFNGHPQVAWVKGEPGAAGYAEVDRQQLFRTDDGRVL